MALEQANAGSHWVLVTRIMHVNAHGDKLDIAKGHTAVLQSGSEEKRYPKGTKRGTERRSNSWP